MHTPGWDHARAVCNPQWTAQLPDGLNASSWIRINWTRLNLPGAPYSQHLSVLFIPDLDLVLIFTSLQYLLFLLFQPVLFQDGQQPIICLHFIPTSRRRLLLHPLLRLKLASVPLLLNLSTYSVLFLNAPWLPLPVFFPLFSQAPEVCTFCTDENGHLEIKIGTLLLQLFSTAVRSIGF